jgi:hypothetical protein
MNRFPSPARAGRSMKRVAFHREGAAHHPTTTRHVGNLFNANVGGTPAAVVLLLLIVISGTSHRFNETWRLKNFHFER